MGDRADDLARQFTAINAETIAALAGYTEAQRAAPCAGERWSVGTTAHHLAAAQGTVMGLAQALGEGSPSPPSPGR